MENEKFSYTAEDLIGVTYYLSDSKIGLAVVRKDEEGYWATLRYFKTYAERDACTAYPELDGQVPFGWTDWFHFDADDIMLDNVKVQKRQSKSPKKKGARMPSPTITEHAFESFGMTVTQQIQKGWRIESQTPTAVRLVRGHPTSHLLHVVLSVLTAGLWVPVWIFLAIVAGEKRKTIWLDPYGKVRTGY